MRTFAIGIGFAAAVAAGCASGGGAGLPDPNAVTFCIENSAVGYGNIVAYVGTARFTVYPNEQVCKDVRPAGADLAIRGGSTSGGAMGPLRFSFRLPSSPGCWHWRVSSAAALDVVPCDE